jgi:hypothetical protein
MRGEAGGVARHGQARPYPPGSRFRRGVAEAALNARMLARLAACVGVVAAGLDAAGLPQAADPVSANPAPPAASAGPTNAANPVSAPSRPTPARAPVSYHETCVPDAGDKGVVSIHVKYDNGVWSVEHTLDNAQVVDRARQHKFLDLTTIGPDGRARAKWAGQLKRNPALFMIGVLGTINGSPVYDEWLTKNGLDVMHSQAVCTFDSDAPALPSLEAFAPATFHVARDGPRDGPCARAETAPWLRGRPRSGSRRVRGPDP